MGEPRKLDLILRERSKVWIAMRDLIRNDETIQRIFSRIYAWDDGQWLSKADVTPQVCPLLTIWPSVGPQGWHDPGSQSGFLVVRVRMAIDSPYVIDTIGVWEALESVFYPPSFAAQNEVISILDEAGAVSGQVEFHIPANDPDPMNSPDGMYMPEGAMRIAVRRGLIPTNL